MKNIFVILTGNIISLAVEESKLEGAYLEFTLFRSVKPMPFCSNPINKADTAMETVPLKIYKYRCVETDKNCYIASDGSVDNSEAAKLIEAQMYYGNLEYWG